MVSLIRADWKLQKLLRLVSIRDRSQILVAVSIDCDDYVKSLISGPLYVENGSPVLDLQNRLVLC